ncbi:MAG: hypothetical protein R3B40_27500 [Polyangiales bacterium]|nr:hypothetical protein [Sandaracinaceae bacterium]
MAREHLFASALLGRTLTVCLVLCTSAAVGRAQAPSDVVIDDGLTWVEAITDNRSDPDNVSFRPGVRLVLRGAVAGATTLTLTLRRGGTTEATMTCPLQGDGRTVAYTEGCTDTRVALRGEGLLELAPSITTSAGQRDLPVLRVRVGRYYSFDGVRHNQPVYDSFYQVVGDDLLLATTVSPLPQGFNGYHQVLFDFWAASHEVALPRPDDARFECTVDGVALGVTLLEGLGAAGGFSARHARMGEEPLDYAWRHYRLSTRMRVRLGGSAALQEGGVFNVSERPGAYRCVLSYEGRVLRTFAFRVTQAGAIAPHAQESGEGALHFTPGTHLVDTFIPAGRDAWDFSIDPTVLRGSTFFGRAWPHPEQMHEVFAALPTRAVGAAVPGAPAGSSSASTRRAASPSRATTSRPRGRRARR